MTNTEHRLMRLLHLAWALMEAAPFGFSAPQLAARAGVSRRTVYRDLHILAAVFPVANEGGVWRWVGRRERRAA